MIYLLGKHEDISVTIIEGALCCGFIFDIISGSYCVNNKSGWQLVAFGQFSFPCPTSWNEIKKKFTIIIMRALSAAVLFLINLNYIYLVPVVGMTRSVAWQVGTSATKFALNAYTCTTSSHKKNVFETGRESQLVSVFLKKGRLHFTTNSRVIFKIWR